MINNCQSLNMEFTVYMEEAEWYRIQHLYTTYDPTTGEIENDSVIKECHMAEDSESIMGCTFELGYIDAFTAYGITKPVQPRAAFMSAVGDLGVLWYDSAWVRSQS